MICSRLRILAWNKQNERNIRNYASVWLFFIGSFFCGIVASLVRFSLISYLISVFYLILSRLFLPFICLFSLIPLGVPFSIKASIKCNLIPVYYLFREQSCNFLPRRICAQLSQYFQLDVQCVNSSDVSTKILIFSNAISEHLLADLFWRPFPFLNFYAFHPPFLSTW